ncbi:hypothetical protein [Sphingomonas sp. PvP056]|jgi:hypothetical protein|uniref:hypothetical protein n=1 Tax=Sphingomonas sp. PvP056 TaxID=3156392 RepID=UPI00263E087A|nr:hypothetical protein [Sphingomonas sp. PsM26]
MSGPNDKDRPGPHDTLRGSLLFLVFGISMLAFLIAIDRPEWFVLKPATGTAVAMSAAPKLTPGETNSHRKDYFSINK